MTSGCSKEIRNTTACALLEGNSCDFVGATPCLGFGKWSLAFLREMKGTPGSLSGLLGVGGPSPRYHLQDWYRLISSLWNPAEVSSTSNFLAGMQMRLFAQRQCGKVLLAGRSRCQFRCWHSTWVEARLSNASRAGDSSRLGFIGRVSRTEYDIDQLREACDALNLLSSRGSHASTDMLYGLLKGCIANKALEVGRQVHHLAATCGYESNTFLANHIIRMYTSLGSLQEASQVFRKLSAPDKFAWGSIILAHGDLGEPKQAIHLYKQVRESKTKLDDRVFVALLRACACAADLASGRMVHADVMDRGSESNLFVGSTLVDMYAKCGSLEEARAVFNRLPTKNVVTWNAMMAGYVQHSDGEEALCLYETMQHDGVIPDRLTFLFTLKACGSAGHLERCKEIHAKILEMNLEADVFVGTGLVDIYGRYGSLEDAHTVFRRLPIKTLVTWNALIAGYAHHGLGQGALDLYGSMQKDSVNPDAVTYSCILKACADVGAIQTGKQTHSKILERGLQDNVIVGGRLVDMYAKCGKLGDAHTVFQSLPVKDVITWNALINGHGQHNNCRMAMQCFEEMQAYGTVPDSATFKCLLTACSHAGLVNEGHQYFKMICDSQSIRPTVEHFTCMVDLLGRDGRLHEAEDMLLTMPFEQDGVGWMSLLTACKTHSDSKLGRRCFDRLMELAPGQASAYVLMSDIYANAGRLEDAEKVQILRYRANAAKVPAKAWTEVNKKVHEFVVGEKRDDISLKLKSMNLRIKDEGHVSQTELVLKPVSEQEKADSLCGHAEKLALAFGLLNTPDGTPLLVTKNLRMCNDCHSGTKILSRIEKREITVRDAHRVHRFTDGVCSCLDAH